MLLLTFDLNSVAEVTVSLHELRVLLCNSCNVRFLIFLQIQQISSEKTDNANYGLKHLYKTGILKLNLTFGK